MHCRQVLLLATLVSYVSISRIECAHILALFQLNGFSHFMMYEALLKGLAAKGHQVDVVSHFPQETPIPNYTDLSIAGSQPSAINLFTVEFALNFGPINCLYFFWNTNLAICNEVIEHPTMRNLLKSNQKYDLVITEIFGVDCFMGFGHKLKAPVVNVMSSVALPWSLDRVGNPDNPAYIPDYFMPFTDRMSFTERLANLVFHEAVKVGSYLLADLPTDRFARKHFGEDCPPLSQLKRNVSLVLVNSHWSLQQARPMVPAVVEVGGLHIQQPQKLPQDIERFLNESEHGVIYFSLGSLVRGETLPEDTLRAFVDAFRELPQRVLWKCDGDAVPDLPPNVKTLEWMPQPGIIVHPKVRVFITHGGLMGTEEAVHAGVPMVGMPLFGDQHQNILNYVTKGVAVQLDSLTTSKEEVLRAIRSVLDNPSYRENAQQLSRQFRDRPQTALDTAVFWIEYVMRHGGAAHLRSAGADLPWFKYLLLDVLTFVLVIVVVLPLGVLWCSAVKCMGGTAKPQGSKTKPPKQKTK